MKDDSIYLRHILDAIDKIQRYRGELPTDVFLRDGMRIDAVVRELMIIGEAAVHISQKFKDSHADIPFADIIGMRNRLIHEYFGVDIDVVLTTCDEDLAMLRNLIEHAL